MKLRLIILALCSIIAWLLYYLLWTSLFPSAEEAGQRGDMFGGFSSLISVSALIAAYGAYSLQNEQSNRQNKQLLEQQAEQTRQISFQRETDTFCRSKI